MVAAAVIGGIAFALMRSSRNKPLEVEIVPGARQVGSEVLRLLQHLGPGLVDGAPRDLDRAGPHGARAARDDVGVVLDEADLLHRHPEEVLDDHGERGAVALAVRRRADGDVDPAVGDVGAGEDPGRGRGPDRGEVDPLPGCLLYTSDAADDLLCVDLGGRRIIKKKTHSYTSQIH